MRTEELLDALAKGSGGVQVNITAKGYTVSTRYQPTRVARSKKSIHAAAWNIAQRLWNSWCPPEVRKALEEYDQHTEALRV
jgi:hypothetical protein